MLFSVAAPVAVSSLRRRLHRVTTSRWLSAIWLHAHRCGRKSLLISVHRWRTSEVDNGLRLSKNYVRQNLENRWENSEIP